MSLIQALAAHFIVLVLSAAVLVLVLEWERTWRYQASALSDSAPAVSRSSTPADSAPAVDDEHEHRDAEHELGESWSWLPRRCVNHYG